MAWSETVIKDPNATVIYTVDWNTNFLSGVSGGTISTSTWVVPTGITSVTESNTTTTTTIKLSGGTLEQSYTLVNRITTSAGLTEDFSLVVIIRDH